MTKNDLAEICRLLQREEDDITQRLVIVENTFRTFRRYDQYDFLELLTLRVRADELEVFTQKLLKLCWYLIDNSSFLP